MGKKVSWFSAVKKVLSSEPKVPSSEPKERKEKKTRKSKGWFWKQKSHDPDPSQVEEVVTTPPVAHPVAHPVPPPPPLRPLKLRDAENEQAKHVPSPPPIPKVKLIDAENEQAKHAYSVAVATAVAAEAAVAAAHAAAEVVRLTSASRCPPKSNKEIAAIKIQTTFRGYRARKALRALKGLARLKSLIQGQFVKRQATTTLRCMQTMSRVQTQIRERRSRMSEQNQALQRQLQQKHERELEKIRTSTGDQWDDRTQSKEQVDAKHHHRQEAATRRERALAYAYTHQQTWRNSPKSANLTFMDPNHPHWGWSWLERWMAARPWETQTVSVAVAKEPNTDSPKKNPRQVQTQIQIRREVNLDNKPSPTAKKQTQTQTPGRQSVSSPRAKTPTSATAGRVSRLSPSPRKSVASVDDDAKSMQSVQSGHRRRHSVTGSPIGDGENRASSSAVSSPKASTSTGAVKARTKMPSPLGLDDSGNTAKKRLSFSGSPAAVRRHSVPPNVDASALKNKGLH